ncbi:MAG TPA: hypothetical protein VFP80_18055 [Thermoanaerobaculia bacterium]|nr:hypothetical protein [Thermoanaerobaculia bacterium]
MSAVSLALPLFLSLASLDPGAMPPETLWALLVDPATPAEDRMRAAEAAKDVLPPEYIPKLAAARLRLDELNKPDPELKQALQRVTIPAGDAQGYAIVRDLPCGANFEERVILETLRKFPMTAEAYGVVRNIVAPRPADFIPRGMPEWTFAGADDWHAAQAFIVDLSPPHETDGNMVFSEPILTISQRMYDLERMLRRMRPSDTSRPVPYTAFLALANRIVHEPIHDHNECLLLHDAGRLAQVADDPPLPAEPRFGSPQECRPALDRFRDWLESHRGELEAGAAREAAQVEEARAKMNRVSLCRQ